MKPTPFSWRYHLKTIKRVFLGCFSIVNLTISKRGLMYLVLSTWNGRFGPKSTSLHQKLDIDAIKPAPFSWRTQLKSIKCVFLDSFSLVKMTVSNHVWIYLESSSWNGHFGPKSTSLHQNLDIKIIKPTSSCWRIQLRSVKHVFPTPLFQEKLVKNDFMAGR